MVVIGGTEDFSVLCGEDALIFSVTCLGGHGAIAASAHVLPDQFTTMHRLAAAGRVEEARPSTTASSRSSGSSSPSRTRPR